MRSNKGEFFPEWEAEVLAYRHRKIDNDPYEPYRGVGVLFNGDAKLLGDPAREDWQVIDQYELKFDPLDPESYAVE